jgi:hypothetical protein
MFTKLTVPIESALAETDKDAHRRYTMILPVNIELPHGQIHIIYSTSEILTNRPWGPSNLLVLYGKENTEGEISFKDASLISEKRSQFASFNGLVNNELIISYNHSTEPFEFTVKDINSGEETSVIILDTYTAGKCWFPKPFKRFLEWLKPADAFMVCGMELVDESQNIANLYMVSSLIKSLLILIATIGNGWSNRYSSVPFENNQNTQRSQNWSGKNSVNASRLLSIHRASSI